LVWIGSRLLMIVIMQILHGGMAVSLRLMQNLKPIHYILVEGMFLKSPIESQNTINPTF